MNIHFLIIQVAVGIRFMATGSMYRDVGDAHGLGTASVCRSVRKTIDLLLSMQDHWISFPVTQ